MQTSQTEISAVVASLTSDIDALYVLDQQAKALAVEIHPSSRWRGGLNVAGLKKSSKIFTSIILLNVIVVGDRANDFSNAGLFDFNYILFTDHRPFSDFIRRGVNGVHGKMADRVMGAKRYDFHRSLFR